MLSTLLVAAALCAPVERAIDPTAQHDLDLALKVESTHLVAVNPTPRPIALVLSDRDHGRRAVLIVPAGAQVETHFAPSALQGLSVSIATRDDAGLCATGSYSLEALRDRTHDFVWFDAHDEQVHAWVWSRGKFVLVDEHARETSGDGASLCAPPLPPAMHVPVITPHDGQRGDIAPHLAKKPLPPV